MTACSSCDNVRQPASGFSLVEMAIAIFIMALLLGGLLVPLQSQVESRKMEETQRLLEQAREALLGYVTAYGYFPCPASDTSNGQEASPDHTNGTCDTSVSFSTAMVGFLPAVTLGFTPVDGEGYALDAWGLTQNRIRYAVANASFNTFTRSNGIRIATMAGIQSATTLLYVCRTGTGVTASGCAASTDKLSDNAIAVIWSLGQNAPNGGAAPHENKNLDNDRVFVSAPYSRVSGSEFDDQLTWIGPPILFNRLVSVGLLP